MLDLEFEEVETGQDAAEMADTEPVNEEGDVFAFRLFGGSDAAEGPKTVKLTEEDDDFVKRERPQSYYFYKREHGREQEFEAVAVSGEIVLEQSQQPYPGMCMPHRVLDYTALAKTAKEERKRSHKRPGKKLRERRRQQKGDMKAVGRPADPRALVVYGRDRLYGARLPSAESLMNRNRGGRFRRPFKR